MALVRRDATRSQADGSGPFAGDSFSSQYPALWEFLTESRWPDGKPRVTGTLTIFYEDGLVKICLNDRDQGLTAWSTAQGAVTALARLEAGLAGDSLEWRAPKGKATKRR